ncbi:MAG: hypothetical protein KAS32_09540 [Candidatus Peribacteraceae bacterium]|nr:hypothetical protein [Candidatus Peribacteraceae bacterium]
MSDELKPFQSNHPYFIDIPPAAPGLAVTLDEAKEFLRADPPSDAELTLLILAAQQCFEAYTRNTLLTTQYKLLHDYLLPSIEMHKTPFQSLTTFKYTVNGSLIDIDSALYYVYLKPDYSKILVKDGESYPQDGDDILQGIEIKFKAGIADDESGVPADIKLALLNHVAFLYENHGDCDNIDEVSILAALPKTSRLIYNKYRILKLVT